MTDTRLEGRRILITGASRGLGRAIARELVAQGGRVFLSARHAPRLEEAANEVDAVGWYAADLADHDACQSLVEHALGSLGRIDLLVNNAGVLGARAELIEYPLEDWEQVIRVNLTSVFWLTQLVGRHMAEREEGRILNVSSGVGRTARAEWGAYCVSKFGLEALTQIAAAELGPDVTVAAVNPGGTRTEMRAAAFPDEDPMTLPTAETIAGAFVKVAAMPHEQVHGKSLDARQLLGI